MSLGTGVVLTAERATGAPEFLERPLQQRRTVHSQGPADVARKRSEVLSRSANLPSVAMRRNCVYDERVQRNDFVHVLRGITPENRQRAAQQLGSADGTAV